MGNYGLQTLTKNESSRVELLYARHFQDILNDPDKLHKLVLEQFFEKDLKDVAIKFDNCKEDKDGNCIRSTLGKNEFLPLQISSIATVQQVLKSKVDV